MPTRPPRFRIRGSKAPTHVRVIRSVERADRQYQLNHAPWRKLRASILRQEPMCRACAAAGKVTPAKQIDHIDEDANNNDPNNLQPLCTPCHSRKTIEAGKGWGSYNEQRATARRHSLSHALSIPSRPKVSDGLGSDPGSKPRQGP